MRKLIASLALLAITCAVHAEVRLPKLISDGMVLQRDVPLKIWGWANPQEKVKVELQGKTYASKAGADSLWQVTLPPSKAGGPFTLTVSGKNTITINDVLIGDVWLCSGQSNMVHQLNIHDVTYAEEIAKANYPQIRQFWVPTATSLTGPQKDVPAGAWKSAVGNDVRPFSAVAYFFAKKLHQQYGVPIGIINASVGGTPIEAWVSEEGLASFTDWKALVDKNKDTAYINQLRTAAQNAPRPVLPNDKGLTEPTKWYEPAYEPKGWRTINIPGYWEDQGVKDLNGIVWYRRQVEVPASMAGKAARVFLGRIVDADELYINGQRVGQTTYQYPQRRYSLPAGLLKAGKNTLVVRVTNTAGKGGFVPDKPYCLFAGTDTIDLKGTWTYKVGAVYPPQPAGGAAPGLVDQNQPAALYNAMVAPHIPYAIKGICWYQGESNTARPMEYDLLLPALIADWRAKWNAVNLPFLYVQLPGFLDYNYLPAESNWARLREAQLKALRVPNTAMAVAIDLGEWNDVHPENKKDVGERMALAARKLAYGENIVYAGPLLQHARRQGIKMVLSFSHTGSGLTTSDGNDPAEFAIAGADKKFVWARAKIEGDKILVWSENVPAPVYVRYAWADNPVNPNLCNKEGLPASPFRTDE